MPTPTPRPEMTTGPEWKCTDCEDLFSIPQGVRNHDTDLILAGTCPSCGASVEAVPAVPAIPTESGSVGVFAILAECQALFHRKNRGYGNSYLLSERIMDVLVPDMSKVDTRYKRLIYNTLLMVVHKLIRASNLIINHDSQTKVKDESVRDTFRDMVVYAAMLADITEKES